MSKTLGIISAMYEPFGDFGTILKRRTLATLPFGGRYRMIDFALSNFVNAGIDTVGVMAPYYYRSLLDHLGAGKSWNLEKNSGGLFVMPGSVTGLMKTRARYILGDIMRNIRIFKTSDCDYVLFADTSAVMNSDLNEFVKSHEKSGCQVSLMYKKDMKCKSRVCLLLNGENRVIRFSTPSDGVYPFWGMILVNRSYLLDLVDNYSNFEAADLLDLIKTNLGKISINAYENKDNSVMVESLCDYFFASMALLDGKFAGQLFDSARPIMTKNQDSAPTFYRNGAKVKNSIVASGCVIEGTVENSIIFRSVHIAPGSTIKNSVIMQHADIGRDVFLSNVVFDRYVSVGNGKTFKGTPESPFAVEKGLKI